MQGLNGVLSRKCAKGPREITFHYLTGQAKKWLEMFNEKLNFLIKKMTKKGFLGHPRVKISREQ